MVSQDGKTITEYLNLVKFYSDVLTKAQSLVPEDDLVIYILNGLASEFTLISTIIWARESAITIKELNDMLIDYENVLGQGDNREINLVVANFTIKGRQNPN